MSPTCLSRKQVCPVLYSEAASWQKDEAPSSWEIARSREAGGTAPEFEGYQNTNEAGFQYIQMI
jgi:hypothetical protein